MDSYSDLCNLPEELLLNIFKYFHPVYDDVFKLSRVCKRWRSVIIRRPDPCLWEKLILSNIRNCYFDSPFLNRFSFILKYFGRYLKVLKIRRCHPYFGDVLKMFSQSLSSLQVFEVIGMSWDKDILYKLSCFKTLENIELEGTADGQDRNFNVSDLSFVVDTFPNIKKLSLHFSSVNQKILAQIQDIVASCYNYIISELYIERAKIEALELTDIIQNLIAIQHFSFGNDQMLGLPSMQALNLVSKSLTYLELFQIGDFREFSFNIPTLKKLTISFATSLKKLSVYAPSLRDLQLNHCPELRKISRINSSSLKELTVKRCFEINWSDLIRFLVRNSDIKSLNLEMNVVSLRLDHNATPSLERLQVLDNGKDLISVDIRCPKLKFLTFKKAMIQPSMLKMINIRAEEMTEVVLRDVPHVKKVILNIPKIKKLVLDFERRFHQIKPLCFTSITLPVASSIQTLQLSKTNLRSIAINPCKIQEVIIESCNLDIDLNTVLDKLEDIKTLIMINSYGPCCVAVQNATLRHMRVISCSAILMDHIDILCPLLETLDIHGSEILPSQIELETTANELKKVSPHLVEVNFSH